MLCKPGACGRIRGWLSHAGSIYVPSVLFGLADGVILSAVPLLALLEPLLDLLQPAMPLLAPELQRLQQRETEQLALQRLQQRLLVVVGW